MGGSDVDADIEPEPSAGTGVVERTGALDDAIGTVKSDTTDMIKDDACCTA